MPSEPWQRASGITHDGWDNAQWLSRYPAGVGFSRSLPDTDGGPQGTAAEYRRTPGAVGLGGEYSTEVPQQTRIGTDLDSRQTRYRPPDALLAFLEAL
jgi:hypothetical protein